MSGDPILDQINAISELEGSWCNPMKLRIAQEARGLLQEEHDLSGEDINRLLADE